MFAKTIFLATVFFGVFLIIRICNFKKTSFPTALIYMHSILFSLCMTDFFLEESNLFKNIDKTILDFIPQKILTIYNEISDFSLKISDALNVNIENPLLVSIYILIIGGFLGTVIIGARMLKLGNVISLFSIFIYSMIFEFENMNGYRILLCVALGLYVTSLILSSIFKKARDVKREKNNYNRENTPIARSFYNQGNNS